MKKKLVSLLALLLGAMSLFVFAGCDSSSSSSDNGSHTNQTPSDDTDTTDTTDDTDDTDPTPKHTHSLVKHAAVEATCKATGNLEYYTCSGCDKVFSDADGTQETTVSAMTVARKEHNFDHYVCQDCQYILPRKGPECFVYEKNDSGDGIVITGYVVWEMCPTTSPCELVIPENLTVDNQILPVVEIAESAFQPQTQAANDLDETVYSIYLPDTLETVGDWAFANLYSLEQIHFGKSVTRIGNYAFANSCDKMKEITIPDTVEIIGTDAFSGPMFGESALKKVTIGRGVTTIGKGAFGDHRALSEAIFLDPVGWSYGTTKMTESQLSDPATAAEWLCKTGSAWSKTTTT